MKKKKYKWTFNEVLEKFEFIEKELCLDKSTILSVPWWDMLRYRLFKDLLAELGCRDRKSKEKEISSKKFIYIKFKSTFNVFKNLIQFLAPRSPLWMDKRSNIILGHPRRKLEKGYYVDPYSDPFIDLFLSSINLNLIDP